MENSSTTKVGRNAAAVCVVGLGLQVCDGRIVQGDDWELRHVSELCWVPYVWRWRTVMVVHPKLQLLGHGALVMAASLAVGHCLHVRGAGYSQEYLWLLRQLSELRWKSSP